MRKVLALATLFLVASSLAVAARPQEKAAQKLRSHSGEVVSVDTVKKEIVIKHRTGKEVTLPLAADVKITKARKEISLSDVKPGDRVTSRCDESSGKCTIKSVSVRAAAAAKS